MGQSIAALLVMSFLLISVVVMFRSTQVGNAIVADAMRKAALHTAERNNTSIELLPHSKYPLAMPPSGCSLSFWVKNSGESSMSNFDQLSILAQFGGTGEGLLVSLNYMQTTPLGLNEWKSTIPLTGPYSTPNDVYQPGVLNKGEFLFVEAVVDGDGKNPGTIVVVTPNGVAVNEPFVFSQLEDDGETTRIMFGQTLSGTVQQSASIAPTRYRFEWYKGKPFEEIGILMSTPDFSAGIDPYFELTLPGDRTNPNYWRTDPFSSLSAEPFWKTRIWGNNKLLKWLKDNYSQYNWLRLLQPPIAHDPDLSDDAGGGDGLNVGLDARLWNHPLNEEGIYEIRAGHSSYGLGFTGAGDYEITLAALNFTPPIYIHCN